MQLKGLFLIFFTAVMLISSVSSYASVTELTDPRIYNASEMPQYTNAEGTNAPVNVIVGLKIKDMTSKIGHSSDYFLIYVRAKVKLSWYDSRLGFTSKDGGSYLFTTNEKAIWRPPLVLVTGTDASFRYIYGYFRIYPNATVTEEISMTLVVKQKYRGTDSTAFSLRFICFNYSTDNLTLEWNDENPLEVVDTTLDERIIGTDGFHVQTCHLSATHISRGHPGNYSCLEVYTKEKTNRMGKISSVAIFYIPGILAVAISWASFWIAVQSVFGHAAILAACLLHLVVQRVSIANYLPLLESVQMINVWLYGCLGFVFASLFQMILVTYFRSSRNQKFVPKVEEDRIALGMTIQEGEEEIIVESRNGEASALCNHFHFLRIWFNRFPSTADAINAICRVLFPLCFVIFLWVFFSTYY